MRFNIGDVVRLKSGGHVLMVVSELGSATIHCVWHNANDELAGAWLALEVLELVDSDEGFYEDDEDEDLSDEELDALAKYNNIFQKYRDDDQDH